MEHTIGNTNSLPVHTTSQAQHPYTAVMPAPAHSVMSPAVGLLTASAPSSAPILAPMPAPAVVEQNLESRLKHSFLGFPGMR